MEPLIAVLGPTASGKSDLALDLARAIGGEIVNCDSLQIYRYLDIGTAKPPATQRQAVPHHLIDIVDPDRLFTAGDYQRVAREALQQIRSRGRIPVVTGGTGFYFRALTNGLFAGPVRSEPLRRKLEARPPGSLHRILTRLDPGAAARIHPHDRPKLIRALEVCLLERQPISRLQPARDELKGFRLLKLGLDPERGVLYERIDRRCQGMFEQGLIEETRRVLDMGFPPESKPLGAIGYREARAVLEGVLTTAQALEDTRKATRRYAKRQWTWFRREPDMQWIRGLGCEPETLEIAKRTVADWLERK